MSRKKNRKYTVPTGLSRRIILRIGFNTEGELFTQTFLAKEFELPITTINYHFKLLIQAKIINSTRQPILLTEKGKKIFTKIKEEDYNYKKKFRVHKLGVRLYIKRPPNNFEQLRNGIFKISNGRYKGLKPSI